jgi:hypothetical protein
MHHHEPAGRRLRVRRTWPGCSRVRELPRGWSDDSDAVEEAKAYPEVFARKSVGQVADHFETIIRRLDRKPAIVGHSFGERSGAHDVGVLDDEVGLGLQDRCPAGQLRTRGRRHQIHGLDGPRRDAGRRPRPGRRQDDRGG